MAKASVDVRNFIQGNKYLPELITIGGVQVNRASFLRMVCASVVELTKPKPLDILTDSYPNPLQINGNIQDGAQLQKQDYVQLAKEINNFIKGNGYAPTLYTTKYGQLSFYDVIYTFSRVLAWYHENKALPNYVTLYNLFQTNKTQFHQAVEKAVGTYNTFTEYYNRIKAKTWQGYYNDIYNQQQEIQRLTNNQPLNCTDHSQLGKAVAEDMDYEALYCRVTCKSGGHIILKVRGKELGSNWVNVDLAAAASSDYSIGSYWCSSYAKPVVIDEAWINSDDGRT